MARRGPGEGTIFYNKTKKLYIARILLGRNPDTGKPIKKEMTARKRADVKKKMDDFLRDNTLHGLKADKSVLDHYINKFLYEIKKPIVTPKTLQRYESIYNTHIMKKCPFIYFAMKDIQTSEIRSWYAELEVSQSTLKLIHILINGSMRLALEDRVINYNPAQLIRMQKPQVEEEDLTAVLSSIEQKNLVDNLDLDKVTHRLIYFILGSGIRLGEALCLRWTDLKDFDEQKHIVITKSLSRVKMSDGKYKDVEKDPKTKASKRAIPLPEKIVTEIKKWEDNQTNDLIFPGVKSYYLFNKTPLRHLQKLCIALEITEVTIRGLRHTYATRHFEAGTSVKTVQSLLGHEKFETTMNIYTHVMSDIKIRDVKNIDMYL